MSRTTLVTAVGSAVLGGIAVGYLAVGPMASAGRTGLIDDPAPAEISPASQADDPATSDSGASPDREERYRDHVREALAPLVAAGTLTDAEVEQIIDALIAARPDVPLGPRGHGRPIARAIANVGEVAAATIGITTEQLREELKDQGTIAAVATAHGVDPQAVIDAIVADATTRIDAKVAAGERATQIKANLPERVTRLVNETPHRHGN